MKPTQDYIERRFQEFNKQYFGGQLPTVPVRLTSARTYLGQLGFKRKRTLLGGTKFYDFILRISTRIDLPEQEVEDTLLHEMIHLYIASKQLRDTSAHGHLFHQLMDGINSRYDRHITISYRRTAAEQDQDTQRRLHLLCVSTFDSGERGITIAAKSRIFELWDVMPTFPHVTETQWYATYDPYFNRYPRTITPKIYRITPNDLTTHLKDARAIRREGSTLYFGKV